MLVNRKIVARITTPKGFVVRVRYTPGDVTFPFEVLKGARRPQHVDAFTTLSAAVACMAKVVDQNFNE